MSSAKTSAMKSPDASRPEFSKIVFYVVAVLAAFALTLGVGIYSGTRQTAIYRAVKFVYEQVDDVWGERETLLKTRPEHFLRPAKYDGAGVVINAVPAGQHDLIFFSGFFKDTNEMRLIRRNGEIVHRWPVSYFKLFPERDYAPGLPESDWNVGTHGALALPDGSIVFIFDYAGLAKVDKCGHVVWTLKHPAHHSVRRSERGGFWVPGREIVHVGEDPKAPFLEPPYFGEALLKISEDGKIEKSISVTDLLIKNNLSYVLTATGSNDLSPLRAKWNEIGHLNKIEELPRSIARDFPLFKAGDLAVSLRDYNLIFVMDPETEKIKWWRIGPWIRQHDPDFDPGGRISVFDNRRDQVKGQYFGGSRVISLDPVTGDYETLFGDRPQQAIYSMIRGQHELRPGGGVMVVEAEGGRVIETDAAGRVTWEYINRYDDKDIAVLTDAIVYDDSYFHVSNWSCD